MNLNKFKNKLLDDCNEQELIELFSFFQSNNKDLIKGIGDDCALCSSVHQSYDLVYTSDATIQDIHFKITDSPCGIGNKAIGRVLSDFAAMGAEPSWIIINLAIPKDYKAENLIKIYESMKKLLDGYDASIIGGDLTKSNNLSLNIFGAGKVLSNSAILRSGAVNNDLIWTTGKLGYPDENKHLNFIPKIKEGKWLRESGFITSMIDITDGLATDLKHLTMGKFGAILYKENLEKMTTSIKKILYNGEDYELLFTANANNTDELQLNWKKEFNNELFFLGRITNKLDNIYLDTKGNLELINKHGYQHF